MCDLQNFPTDRRGVVRKSCAPLGSTDMIDVQLFGTVHGCFKPSIAEMGACASVRKGPLITTTRSCSRTTGGIFAARGWAVATALKTFKSDPVAVSKDSFGGSHPC